MHSLAWRPRRLGGAASKVSGGKTVRRMRGKQRQRRIYRWAMAARRRGSRVPGVHSTPPRRRRAISMQRMSVLVFRRRFSNKASAKHKLILPCMHRVRNPETVPQMPREKTRGRVHGVGLESAERQPKDLQDMHEKRALDVRDLSPIPCAYGVQCLVASPTVRPKRRHPGVQPMRQVPRRAACSRTGAEAARSVSTHRATACNPGGGPCRNRVRRPKTARQRCQATTATGAAQKPSGRA